MSWINLLLLFYAVLIVLIVYLWFFSDTEDDSINGSLSRFFIKSIPKFLHTFSTSVCGSTITGYFSKTFHYIAYERNPLLVLTYLFIINAAFICWLLFGVDLLPNDSVGTFHYYFAFFGVIFSQFTFYLACTTSPGVLCKETARSYGHQPFDGLMYTSGYYCRTCLVPKVSIRNRFQR